MQTQWHTWLPLPSLNQKYTIESVSYSREDGLIILLENDSSSSKVKVTFPYQVDAYKETIESSFEKALDIFGKNENTDFSNYTFFKTYESKYLRWLSQESYTTIDSPHIMHFMFLGKNSIVEVVYHNNPIIKKV